MHKDLLNEMLADNCPQGQTETGTWIHVINLHCVSYEVEVEKVSNGISAFDDTYDRWDVPPQYVIVNYKIIREETA